MTEIPASIKTLRRQLGDALTVAMVTSARIDAQEQAEKLGGPIEVAIGIRVSHQVKKVKEFTQSAAYLHAMQAYLDGTVTLSDLARALEPLRPMLPWLVSTKKG